MFDQINAALVSTRDFFQKYLKKSYHPKLLNSCVCVYSTLIDKHQISKNKINSEYKLQKYNSLCNNHLVSD